MSDDFLRLVTDADQKMRRHFPQARFCSASKQGLYENSPWTFTFRVNDKTAEIVYAQGAFGDPTLLDHPPLGVRDVPLPIGLALQDAQTILHHAHVHGVVTHIELSWPNYPGVHQPHYMFELGGDEIWFVGIRDRKVQRSPIRETAETPS